MSETWQEIASAVAWRHGVTLEDMRGPRVFRKVAYARHEAFSELYKTGRFSLPRIGKWFGDRDHTTVLHGIRKHDARQDMHRQVESGGQSGSAGSVTVRPVTNKRTLSI
jgi:chromosomal replication initiation ATPase DnaA